MGDTPNRKHEQSSQGINPSLIWIKAYFTGTQGMSSKNSVGETSYLRTVSNEANPNSGHQLATKIKQDINFLKDRIERVKRLHTPNSSVLRTYESMLSTRLAVLDWMRDNGQLDDLEMAPPADLGGAANLGETG